MWIKPTDKNNPPENAVAVDKTNLFSLKVCDFIGKLPVKSIIQNIIIIVAIFKKEIAEIIQTSIFC
jgi:hypothetical protein